MVTIATKIMYCVCRADIDFKTDFLLYGLWTAFLVILFLFWYDVLHAGLLGGQKSSGNGGQLTHCAAPIGFK